MLQISMIIIMCIKLMNFCIETTNITGIELIYKDPSIMNNKLISILKLCYGGELNNIVVINDNTIHEFYESPLVFSQLFSIIFINNNYVMKSNDLNNLPLKSNIFVVATNSSNNIEIILLTLRNTRWWNNQAFFYVIGISSINANKVFEAMWRMNILSAILICVLNKTSVTLLTYNPFTDFAPYPWQRIDHINKSNQRWNLYSRQYNEDRSICINLKLDKTKLLDGYNIKAVATPKASESKVKIANKEYNISHLMETAEFEHAIYFKSIFKELNVTVKIHYDEVGFWNNHTPNGFLKSIIEEKYDIALHSRAIRFSQNLTTTYPFRLGGAGILTQYRHFLRPHEKIMRFYSIGVILLTTLSLFISFMVMVIYIKRSITLALLEILRIVLFTGFLQKINRQSVRIFFFGIFLLIVVLNATFTSKLSAFLTQPERRYVMTIDDLVELNYDVCIPEHVANKNDDWTRGEIKKLQILPGDGCYKNVVNYQTSACIGPIARLVPLAVKYRLYLSYTIINDEYLVYWSRKEWPLIQRVDAISSKLMEGGFLDYWRAEALIVPLKKLANTEVNATIAQYRPIYVYDLLFVFYLLIIGLTFSTTVFIFEIIWK